LALVLIVGRTKSHRVLYKELKGAYPDRPRVSQNALMAPKPKQSYGPPMMLGKMRDPPYKQTSPACAIQSSKAAANH
jgi:hypothetical protein